MNFMDLSVLNTQGNDVGSILHFLGRQSQGEKLSSNKQIQGNDEPT